MHNRLNAPPQMDTPRLTLRKPTLEDAEKLFHAYTKHADVAHYTSWLPHRREDETRSFLQLCLEEWSNGSSYSYAIDLRDSADGPVGIISLRPLPFAADFGYVIGRPHWGHGYMTEALSELVDWSLAQPEIWRASAFCDIDNLASARVMEKAGMTFEGILRRYFVHPNISSEPRDCRVYAKVRT